MCGSCVLSWLTLATKYPWVLIVVSHCKMMIEMMMKWFLSSVLSVLHQYEKKKIIIWQDKWESFAKHWVCIRVDLHWGPLWKNKCFKLLRLSLDFSCFIESKIIKSSQSNGDQRDCSKVNGDLNYIFKSSCCWKCFSLVSLCFIPGGHLKIVISYCLPWLTFYYPLPPFSECHYRLISEMPAVIRMYDPD